MKLGLVWLLVTKPERGERQIWRSCEKHVAMLRVVVVP
jgi:hypothetical protein